jgi:hypothetical protein
MRSAFPLRGGRLLRLSGCAAVLLLAAGCGGTWQAGSAGTIVQLKERDFAISGPRQVAAGTVVLRVANDGPGDHELIVVRAPDPRLRLRKDGLTVDEEGLQGETLGALEPGAPGAVRELRVQLTPGRYVFFCNMSGHYLGGMHTTLVVG